MILVEEARALYNTVIQYKYMWMLVLQIEWAGLLFLVLFPLIMSDESFIPLFGILDFFPKYSAANERARAFVSCSYHPSLLLIS